MNSEEVRKKRLEEIEQKKKRLEEMRKSRSAVAAPDISKEPHLPSLADISISDKSENLIQPGLNSVAEKEIGKDVNVEFKSGFGARSVHKLKHFSYHKAPELVVNIPPREKVLYDKYCQTEEPADFIALGVDSSNEVVLRRDSTNGGSEDEVRVEHETVQKNQQARFSESEKLQIIKNQEFQHFFKQSALKIERELEYLHQYNSVRSILQQTQQGVSGSDSILRISHNFDEKTVSARAIVFLAIHEKNPNLFLTCHSSRNTVSGLHSRNIDSQLEDLQDWSGMNGLVCVWSRDLHRRPELKLYTTSTVSVAVFGNDERDFVVGGCENGQIVCWDLHSAKAVPIQKSSVTNKGHKYPVFAIHVTGGHVAYAMSVDGTICQWDLSRLVEPLYLVFVGLQQNIPNQFSSTDSSFLFSPQSDKGLSNFNLSAVTFVTSDSKVHTYIGTGSGQLMRVPMPRKANEPITQVDAHNGLITAIHFHSHSSKLRNHFLTSSVDWTIKLWNSSNLFEPVLEFFTPYYDYICDVQWSPSNPTVFATITSSGTLSLWNLSKSVNEPLENVSLLSETHEENSKGGKNSVSTSALNKAAWSNDGCNILIGDSLGIIRNVTVSSSILSNMEESKQHSVFQGGSEQRYLTK